MSATTNTFGLTTFRYSSETKTFFKKTVGRTLGPREVLIQTTHAGICYTDVHAKEKGCGLGHEGVGIVLVIGRDVTSIQVGDRVGWGWLHHSCGHCVTCVEGYRQYCAEARGFAYGELDQGAFGDFAMWDETFVYRIPDGISSCEAAPLMCAGASVYEALDAAGTKPSDRIGIVGMGGLGHMALTFADHMGYAVTVFSNSERKMTDATAMGADEFRMLKPPGEYVNLNRATAESPTHSPINVLLITSNEVPDLGPLLPFLARRATIVLMTIQTKPLLVPYMSFILPGHRIIVSTEASRKNHLAMLEFADRKGIAPLVEEFPMTEAGIKLAFAKLERGEMRYRGVLVAQEPEHGRKRHRASSQSEDSE